MAKSDPIDNNEDMIDSRDIIARIDYLAFLDDGHDDDETPEQFQDLWQDELAELKLLRKLAEDGEELSDWQDGAALIRESYFEVYAQVLAEDLGEVRPTGWPYKHIDWEAAAASLRQDYREVDFDGVTYLAR